MRKQVCKECKAPVEISGDVYLHTGLPTEKSHLLCSRRGYSVEAVEPAERSEVVSAPDYRVSFKANQILESVDGGARPDPKCLVTGTVVRTAEWCAEEECPCAVCLAEKPSEHKCNVCGLPVDECLKSVIAQRKQNEGGATDGGARELEQEELDDLIQLLKLQTMTTGRQITLSKLEAMRAAVDRRKR
jgi:hypothetical protein